MDYFDILLAKKLSGGGGGEIVLEDITITENGVVTAPSGKAYKKITTDVPLPQDAYINKSLSGLPQPIAIFSDGSNLPMPSLKVGIEPVQDLHGYDSPWVGGAGRNLFSVGSRVDGTIADVRYTSDDEYIYLNGTKQGVGYADLSSASNITLDSGTYYIRAFVVSGTASNTVELYPYDGTNNLTGNIINNERTLTLSESKTFRFRFAIWSDGTVLTNYKVGIVVSKTSSIDKFYPYSNICPISGWDEVNVTVADDVDNPTVTHTYTIPFTDSQGNPIDVFGGECDVVNGIIKPNIEYDSYNGETLVGRWISDRDVYAEGTTPTIGAQVVDLGAYGSDISVQPTSIKSLEGVNNVWADTGDIEELSYFSKPSEG